MPVNLLEAWADKNTVVSFQGHVVPPDTYRGEKWVSLKPPKPTPMSRVKKIIRYISHPRIACGKGKLMARQITSGQLFRYFSSMQRQVSAAIKLI
jgi:hypothetical protein